MKTNEEILLKFFLNMMEVDLNNVDALLQMREMAMNQWEQKQLTDSEHCTIEAYLDSKLAKL